MKVQVLPLAKIFKKMDIAITTWGIDGHEHEWVRLPGPDPEFPDWVNWEACRHCDQKRKNIVQEMPLEEYPA